MQNLAFIQEVIELTNQFRISNNLNPLSVDLDLGEAAQQHSQNMAAQDFFSHTGQDGSRSWQRAQNAGYESTFVGENIAVGYRTPTDVVDGWIASDGHRENLLNPDYNEIGVGYYFLEKDTGIVNYNTYWTQVLGRGEIEQIPTINPLQYGASHPDLIQAFGYNSDAFLQHYIQYGYYENRSVDRFQAAQYLASYDDLIGAFGYNLEAVTQHYIQHGYSEGRSIDAFSEGQYLASHADLINAFGYDLEAATKHYILFGASENRATDLFNPETYLNKYSDLQTAFGENLDLATRHYIEYGYAEGRVWA